MNKKQVAVLSFVCGVALSSVSVAAASSQNVQAILQDVNFSFNGQSATGEALNYNGHLYVPVRFIGESLGADVGWDGSTVGVQMPFTPPPKGNNVTYINQMQTLSTSVGGGNGKLDSLTDNLGNTYNHGGIYAFTNWGDEGVVDNAYFLDGDYTELKGTLCPNSYWPNHSKVDDIGGLQIYADGNLVYDSGAVPSDLTKPISVDVSLKGVSKLEVKLVGKGDDSILFANAAFIK